MLNYESIIEVTSTWAPSVRYRIERMSFGRRLELTRRVRDLLARHEFHAAGDSPLDRVEASALAMEIDRLYWRWGVLSVEGIAIGGEPATLEMLIDHGPEGLVHEIVAAVKRECGLTEDERKN
jgi:hypothetical protein